MLKYSNFNILHTLIAGPNSRAV